jgi:WD40 repeat protein
MLKLCDRLLENTLTGHTGSITKISMIDSDTLISGSTDLNVIVWDIGTGQRRHILTGHAQPVRTLKQHKSLLLTGSDDGPIYVWNLEDGNCVRVLEGHDRLVWALNFNEDATLLAAGASLGKMRIWELATG